jgi:hypothetical protein
LQSPEQIHRFPDELVFCFSLARSAPPMPGCSESNGRFRRLSLKASEAMQRFVASKQGLYQPLCDTV